MVKENQISEMLTTRDVARLLHVHPNTVRRWSDRRLMRAYRISHRGDRRFKREDIARFLAELSAPGGNQEKASSTQR